MNSTTAKRLEPGRARGASAGAVVAALVVAHHPVADAQPSDASPAPALVVFAEPDARADRPALSAEAAFVLEGIRSDPAASNIRIGHSDPAPVLATQSLSLPLPSASEACTGSTQTGIVFTEVDVSYNEEGLASLYARDETTDSEIALVVDGPDVLGSVSCGADTYSVHPLGGGATAVYEFDASQLRRHPPGWEGFVSEDWAQFLEDWQESMHGQVPDSRPRGDPGTPEVDADTGEEIDILVAYTPEAARRQGNIDAFIQFAVDNTNRSYGNSSINLRLRVVYKHEVDYSQDSDMRMDLRHLTYTASDRYRDGSRPDPEGYMDEIHGLRDRYGADLVALIVSRRSNYCGFAWIPDFLRNPGRDWADRGFSITAQSCESLSFHTFAHEIGHNQGAAHDPFNASFTAFPHGHGLCNNAANWNTIMSYGSNGQGECRREIPYFSSPRLRYQGTPTGDAAVRDNRRVLVETAQVVANYRPSKTRPTTTHTLAMVPPASDRFNLGFIRIVNRSDRAGTVRIRAIDDTGRRFGPVPYAIGARETKYFNSIDLENGSDRRLPRGVGDGTGNWRLELSADVDIEPLAYIRTSDGFLTSMNALAAETRQGSTWRYHVPYFQPASPDGHRGRLRLINPGAGAARVTVSGVDDFGNPGEGSVGLTLAAGAARNLTTEELEQGGSALSGRLGDGVGRWRLAVASDAQLQVMSLLKSVSNHLTNVSRGQSENRQSATHTLATVPPASRRFSLSMVPPASDRFNLGFIRIINRSERAGTVQVLAIDDTGRRFGPVPYPIDPRETRYFNSIDLENGSDRRLPRGVGDGTGNWRLELSADVDIEPLAYIRTSDGFLTSMSARAAETRQGSEWRYHVPYFQPASPDGHRGRLRLINPGAGAAHVTLTGVDDFANPGEGGIALSLAAGAARNLTTEEIEQGGSGLSGRLGDGVGRWQLAVASDARLQVASLLKSASNHLTNVSRGRAEAPAAPPPPPPPGQPDLVVLAPSVNDSILMRGEAFPLFVTVRNQGSARSAATRLRLYRSTDATIARSDTEISGIAVRALGPSGTHGQPLVSAAPSDDGTYYYGACVDAVPRESEAANNCSSAVRVTVTELGYLVGVIAAGWKGTSCTQGYDFGVALNAHSVEAARSRAESECRNRGLLNCAWRVWFSGCGALAYGESPPRCSLVGGWGSTRSAAEQRALARCGERYATCRIAVGASGSRGTFCNEGAGTALPAETRPDSSSAGAPADAGDTGPDSPAGPDPTRR